MQQSKILTVLELVGCGAKLIQCRFISGSSTVWILFVVLNVGCGAGGSIDVNVAKKSLEAALNSWKDGKSPSDLTNGSPPINVIEADWKKENKLVDYEIVKEEKVGDHSLLVTVNLKLKSTNGKPTTPLARYIVNTVPEITVFRKVGP